MADSSIVSAIETPAAEMPQFARVCDRSGHIQTPFAAYFWTSNIWGLAIEAYLKRAEK